METLWDAVKRFGISARNDVQKGAFTIPDGHALLAADQVHKMLPWMDVSEVIELAGSARYPL